MASVIGSVISRVCEGALDIDVEFRYEAEYRYEVVGRELFERNMGGNPPTELLDRSITSCFRIAFERSYPDGLSPNEMEQPDECLLMRNLKDAVDEEWKQFFGIALSSFALRSFQAEPAALVLIQQSRSMLKTPQQMAQEMLEKLQAAKREALASQNIKCPYCDSVVVPKPEGNCPDCGAPLK